MNDRDVSADADDLPSDAGVGGALAYDARPPGASLRRRRHPQPEREVAGDEERIAGIVAQTRADVGHQGVERVAEVLRQRFAESGIDVAPERVTALAAGGR